jgi:uncharacterized protein involved in response to NO
VSANKLYGLADCHCANSFPPRSRALQRLLLAGNFLVHLNATNIADTAELGNRIGIATLLVLISLVGGRIVPSFTRNWLVKNRPGIKLPQPKERLDQAALIVIALALVLWAAAPDTYLPESLICWRRTSRYPGADAAELR